MEVGHEHDGPAGGTAHGSYVHAITSERRNEGLEKRVSFQLTYQVHKTHSIVDEELGRESRVLCEMGSNL
jgi:hypothetical protein